MASLITLSSLYATNTPLILVRGVFLLGHKMKIKDKRVRSEDRRQNEVMPRVPFKDSNGATITECRRQVPDRRIDNIHAEWINETVIR